MKQKILTDRYSYHSSNPDIISWGENLLCVWQESTGKNDTIYLAEVDAENGKILCKTMLTKEAGIAFSPRMFVSGDRVVISWSEKKEDQWNVCSVNYRDGNIGRKNIHAIGSGEFDPIVVINGRQRWLFWTSYNDTDGEVCALEISDSGSVPMKISRGIDNAGRPDAKVGYDGAIWLVFDGYDEGCYNIYTCRIDDSRVGNINKINTSGIWANRPRIVSTADSMLVTWYETAVNNEVSYWSKELLCINDSIIGKNNQEIDRTHNWHCWLSMCIDSENKQPLFLFARGWKDMGMRRYQDGMWSAEYKITSGGDFGVRKARAAYHDGRIALLWQLSEGNGHRHRMSDICITLCNNVEELDCVENTDKGNEFTKAISIRKEISHPSADEISKWKEQNDGIFSDRFLLWGDIHGQSCMSDGQGEVDAYFRFAEEVAGLDFSALTDHDCFPNMMSPAEWEYSCAISNAYNRNRELTTILAYEWTSNEYKYDYGHKNVYFPGDKGAFYRCIDENANTSHKLFENIKKHGAICIPHHPAAIWGKIVSAATDWDYHDEEVQRLVEIYSRHGAFEYFGNSSVYTKNGLQKPGHSAVDALKKDYKLGFIAGSDSHQFEHGIEGGILAVYATGKSRKDIFNGLYNRAVYATTGARIHLEFSINDTIMGGVLPDSKDEKLTMSFRCLGTSIIKDISIITNTGEYDKFKIDNNSFNLKEELSFNKDISWYYVRVNQYDHHTAWSSPIWVK